MARSSAFVAGALVVLAVVMPPAGASAGVNLLGLACVGSGTVTFDPPLNHTVHAGTVYGKFRATCVFVGVLATCLQNLSACLSCLATSPCEAQVELRPGDVTYAGDCVEAALIGLDGQGHGQLLGGSVFVGVLRGHVPVAVAQGTATLRPDQPCNEASAEVVRWVGEGGGVELPA